MVSKNTCTHIANLSKKRMVKYVLLDMFVSHILLVPTFQSAYVTVMCIADLYKSINLNFSQ